jgi:hypothetical protein
LAARGDRPHGMPVGHDHFLHSSALTTHWMGPRRRPYLSCAGPGARMVPIHSHGGVYRSRSEAREE